VVNLKPTEGPKSEVIEPRGLLGVQQRAQGNPTIFLVRVDRGPWYPAAVFQRNLSLPLTTSSEAGSGNWKS